MRKILLILLVTVSFATLAQKLSYIYLAEKNGSFVKKISVSRQQYDSMTADGWKFYAFDNESDIPANPIIDNSTVRQMTAAEIEAATNAAKLARVKFTKLEIREAFKALGKEADLDNLLKNNTEFEKYWNDATEIDLTHPVTVQALANFTAAEIEAIKLAIQ